jgi:amidohydrolase
VARNVDPLESAVVSVTTFHAGETFNVIPQRARLTGTVRSLKPGVQDLAEQRIGDIAPAIAAAHGARASVAYSRNYPVTANHPAATEKAARIAREVGGEAQVNVDAPPVMGGEDFSFMLQARPGAFIFLGNGDTAGLHNPAYDFNDEAIPYGASYWARLAEVLMPTP